MALYIMIDGLKICLEFHVFNALFKINRTNLNSIRVKILSRIYKNDSKRMAIKDKCTQYN